ncbi:MAG: hypothetical protein DWQ35_13970 [Planctomycetota bacterium]|nr:MAG: hypothetical protein DWQ35_13970 [Planctomycetota bacterium]REK25949.1 MAG: hypothetical protein DWQ42_09985 [Planctomycetota bacterium]REK46935.1 MAG: hypothetical protein DWQ46_05415 [Planctomycetota bacterium]
MPAESHADVLQFQEMVRHLDPRSRWYQPPHLKYLEWQRPITLIELQGLVALEVEQARLKRTQPGFEEMYHSLSRPILSMQLEVAHPQVNQCVLQEQGCTRLPEFVFYLLDENEVWPYDNPAQLPAREFLCGSCWEFIGRCC